MRLSDNETFDGQRVEQESSWRYLASVAIPLIIFCGVFIYLYLGPRTEEIFGEAPRPTISDETLDVEIGGIEFEIPANYTIYPKDRRGGKKAEIALYVFWPTMNGYSPARRDDFIEHRKNSRRIDVVIEERTSVFSEKQRLELLFLPHVIDKRGTDYDYGLSRFVFKQIGRNAPTNGYSDKTLFIGSTPAEDLVVFFCYDMPDEKIAPEECWREYELSDDVSVKYLFKRTYLPEWQSINEKVLAFVRDITKSNL